MQISLFQFFDLYIFNDVYVFHSLHTLFILLHANRKYAAFNTEYLIRDSI